MNVRRERVRAPQHDQPRAVDVLHIRAYLAAERDAESRAARRRADRAFELARAEPVKEAPVHAAALHDAHRAAVTVRQDTFRSVRRFGDFVEARGDFGDGIVPGDARESPFAFRADAAHWVKQAVGMIDALKIARDFGAQKSARRRVRVVAGYVR